MPRHLDEQDNLERFLEEYGRPLSDAAKQVERAVLGHEVGLNGYTTVEQAGALGTHLGLSHDSSLLDVGAGRGWPGSHLAALSACRLVSSDIPFDALKAAKGQLAAGGAQDRAHAVVADGRALPLGSNRFDALVHADVFC